MLWRTTARQSLWPDPPTGMGCVTREPRRTERPALWQNTDVWPLANTAEFSVTRASTPSMEGSAGPVVDVPRLTHALRTLGGLLGSEAAAGGDDASTAPLEGPPVWDLTLLEARRAHQERRLSWIELVRPLQKSTRKEVSRRPVCVCVCVCV